MFSRSEYCQALSDYPGFCAVNRYFLSIIMGLLEQRGGYQIHPQLIKARHTVQL